MSQWVKNPPVMQETQETWVRFWSWEDFLEEGMATHSSILAWKILWTEEPGRLQSIGSPKIWHYWAAKHTQTHMFYIYIYMCVCIYIIYIYIKCYITYAIYIYLFIYYVYNIYNRIPSLFKIRASLWKFLWAKITLSEEAITLRLVLLMAAQNKSR